MRQLRELATLQGGGVFDGRALVGLVDLYTGGLEHFGGVFTAADGDERVCPAVRGSLGGSACASLGLGAGLIGQFRSSRPPQSRKYGARPKDTHTGLSGLASSTGMITFMSHSPFKQRRRQPGRPQCSLPPSQRR